MPAMAAKTFRTRKTFTGGIKGRPYTYDVVEVFDGSPHNPTAYMHRRPAAPVETPVEAAPAPAKLGQVDQVSAPAPVALAQGEPKAPAPKRPAPKRKAVTK